MYQVSYKSNSIDNSALAKASSLFCDHFPLSFSLLSLLSSSVPQKEPSVFCYGLTL